MAACMPRDKKSQATEKSQKTAKTYYTSLFNCKIVKGRQHEVHLDFVRKAPERSEYANLGYKVLYEQKV
jgi:Zn/Cd-binding protein ZinT